MNVSDIFHVNKLCWSNTFYEMNELKSKDERNTERVLQLILVQQAKV